MTSREKILAFKAQLLQTDETFDGIMGMLQAAAAAGEMGLGPTLEDQIPQDPADFDQTLVDVAGFCLWLRSDDAPTVDIDVLTKAIPAAVAELAADAGLIH